MQRLHRLGGQSFLNQFLVHILDTDLVQFVDCHRDVDNLVGLSDYLGDTRQNLAVVDMQAYTDTQAAIHLLHYLYQFHFADERVGADHVHITLVELAVTPFLRAVGTPDGLYLETLEGELYLVAVLHHKARKRYGQVVAQPFFTHDARGFADTQVCPCELFAQRGHPVARIEYLEEQFVALLAVFAHQRAEILHCGGLNLLKAIQSKYRFDRIEDVVTTRHLYRREVARTLWNTWFLCHIFVAAPPLYLLFYVK